MFFSEHDSRQNIIDVTRIDALIIYRCYFKDIFIVMNRISGLRLTNESIYLAVYVSLACPDSLNQNRYRLRRYFSTTESFDKSLLKSVGKLSYEIIVKY